MDWIDIILHAVIAAAIVILGAHLAANAWIVAVAMAITFFVREACQARTKYGRWLLPWQWSAQKLLEAIAPAVAAFGAATGIAMAAV